MSGAVNLWTVTEETATSIHPRAFLDSSTTWRCPDCFAASKAKETLDLVKCIRKAIIDPVYTGNKSPREARLGDTWEYEEGKMAYAVAGFDRNGGTWVDPSQTKVFHKQVKMLTDDNPLVCRVSATSVQVAVLVSDEDETMNAYEEVWLSWGGEALQQHCRTNKKVCVLPAKTVKYELIESPNDPSSVLLRAYRVTVEWLVRPFTQTGKEEELA